MKNTDTPKDASALDSAKFTINGHRISLPTDDTLPAIVLALMLQGRKVSTPALIYSAIHATRLPAYIGNLREDRVLSAFIVAKDLPLTEQQKRRRHSTPFKVYHLEPEAIMQLGTDGQLWARRVIKQWRVSANDYPKYDEVAA